jgi:hypothetical protein
LHVHVVLRDLVVFMIVFWGFYPFFFFFFPLKLKMSEIGVGYVWAVSFGALSFFIGRKRSLMTGRAAMSTKKLKRNRRKSKKQPQIQQAKVSKQKMTRNNFFFVDLIFLSVLDGAPVRGKVGKPKKITVVQIGSTTEIKKNDWRVDESSIKKLDVASKWKPESQIEGK